MIYGKKILLRTFSDSDVASVARLRNEAAAQMPYNGQSFVTESVLMRQYQDTGLWTPNSGTLLVCSLDGDCLGEIDFEMVSSHIATLAYMLYKSSDWGKGYISEALILFVADLFSTRAQLNRLQLYTHTENMGSIRVAEKAGFTKEGIARETFFNRGAYCDQYLYSILRKEWSRDRKQIIDA